MKSRIYAWILWLAIFTIVYNFLEGFVSVWMGLEDETLALFGFGVDSFVEMISGIGIVQMVIRIKSNPHSPISDFEKRALQITGSAFYLLTVGLIAAAVINILNQHKPETTWRSIIISLISIAVMYWLYHSKIKYGKKIDAAAVIADGRCTLVCIYMSVVLLVSGLIFELTGFGWIDTVGALGLAWFSFREGREAFEKASGKECCDQC